MAKNASNQDPIKIAKSEYVFTRPGINDQYVSDARSMVWSEDGYPRVRLGILNKYYKIPWEIYDISFNVIVYREMEGPAGMDDPVVNENVSLSVCDSDKVVIDKWVDLKGCNCPDRYRLVVYCGSVCVFEETFTRSPIQVLTRPDPA